MWVGVWYYTEFLAWLILIPIQMYAKARTLKNEGDAVNDDIFSTFNHRHE